MYGQSNAATIDEYIEELAEPRKSDVRALHELIQHTVPTLEPTMEFGMPGYGTYHYVYASGREGDWPLVSIASNKNYISLYVSAATPDGEYVAESYKDRLPKASIGKSCVRFKKHADVDQKVIARLLKEAMKYAPTSARSAR